MQLTNLSSLYTFYVIVTACTHTLANKRDVVQQKQHAAAASMLACSCQQTSTRSMRTWVIHVREMRTPLNLLHAFAQYIIERKTTDPLAPVLLHHIVNHEDGPMLHFP